MVEELDQDVVRCALTFHHAQLDGRGRLNLAGVETPEIDARVLLAAAAGMSHAQMLSSHGDIVKEKILERYEAAIARRIAGEPVHRIIGYREFYGRNFSLSKATLEPRPETELLVDAVLAHFPNCEEALRILDVGAGTGVIAISLLAERPNAVATAIDISDDALATVDRNAARHGVNSRLDCIHSNLFDRVTGEFDIIVSNPPYIESDTIENLQAEVRLHDPVEALDGGHDGLDFYRAILKQAAAHLSNDGQLFLELGVGQLAPVRQIAIENGWLVDDVLKDLANIDRVMCLKYRSVANLPRR